MIDLALGVLALCLVAVLIRLWRGPTSADRAVAMDYAFFVVIAAMALVGVRQGLEYVVVIVVAGTLVGFLAVVAVAYLIERRES